MRAVPVVVALACLVACWSRVSMATTPIAYLPGLTVRSLSVSSPTQQPSGGFVQLTPKGCPGSSCSGFKASNAADFSSRTNTATFSSNANKMQVDPWNTQTYELGTFRLTNGGFAVPADGGAPLVPMSVSLQVATQGSGKSTSITLPFLLQWSPGSPAGPNNAGLFVLVTKASGSTPAPSQNFSMPLSSEVSFNMRIELVGWVVGDAGSKDVTILGDWGQQPPAAGQPGPRAHVKQGASTQAVKLMARISKLP